MITGLKADLPLLSSTLPEKSDIYGREIDRYEGQAVTMRLFNAVVNPVNIRNAKQDPVSEEVYRLFKETGQTEHIPGIKGFKVMVNGKRLELTPQQVTDYQFLVGSMSWIETSRLMRSNGWNVKSPSFQQKLIARAVRDSGQASRIVLFDANPHKYSERARKWARKARNLKATKEAE